jgi:hypothetical protein
MKLATPLLALAAAVFMVAGTIAVTSAATLEVTQPVKLTSNAYYERGQSMVYDGADYWLFYGRSATVTGNYGNDNPDVNDYVVYYKKASSVPALAGAAASAVVGANNANGYLGETGAVHYGSDVWSFATVDVGTSADLYGWWTNDGGGTWNEVGPILTGLSDGQAHHDEVVFSGRLYVLEGSGNFTTRWSTTPKTGGWSTPATVGTATGGLAHFFVDGSTLYLATWSAGTNTIYEYNLGGDSWSVVASTASPGYDPTLVKVGGSYMFAQAPYSAPSQYTIQWNAATLDGSFFSGSSHEVTEGGYGANGWVDMWPIGFTDAGSTTWLLYTSERDTPAAEGTGNIWALEVDWDLSNDHYTYLQTALDDAVGGDTVEVGAGTYTENVVVSAGVTLSGAQAGVDARGRSATESIITASSGHVVNVQASSVVIDGFHIPGSASVGQLIRCESGGDALQVRNCILGGGGGGGRIFWFNITASNVVIEQNDLDATGMTDSYALAHFDGSDVFDNLIIRDNDFANGGIFAGNAAYNSTNMLMEGNLFDGASLNLSSQFQNSTITENTFRNNGYTNAQMGLKNSTISKNTFESAGPSPYAGYPSYALMLWGNQYSLSPSDNVTVENNTFEFNAISAPDELSHGLRILAGIDATTITVSDNSFDDGGAQAGAMGVVNQATGVADASGNWWGSNTAGSVSAAANGGVDVDYTPWLDVGTDTSADPGFQGDFSTLHVDDDSPQSGALGRIQEGVDLVTASTVNVLPGTYVEQVEITMDMVLQGAGATTIIQSPATLTKKFTTSADNYPIVYIHDAADVEIRDLVVDGQGNGNANVRFVGVGYRNAGGGVYNCEITDVRDTPFSGAQHGVALYAYNDDAVTRHIDVHGCNIHDFQKNAMALNSSATTALTVDVDGNTVTGYGATTVTAQNGIQVWSDLGSGTVSNNVVSDIAYDNTSNPTKWVASSILNYYADLDITDNTVGGVAHVGVYNIDGSGDITGNTIEIQKIGVYAFGIIATDPPRAVPSPFMESGGGGAQGVSGPQRSTTATLAVDVSYNDVSFSGGDNTDTYGIEADAGWGPNDMAVTANHNTVTGFDVGFEFYQCQSSCDTGVFTSITANYNAMSGNSSYGMRSNASYITANGLYNWWDDASGPYHPTLNPGGTGNTVSDYIDFMPYMLGPSVVSLSPVDGITNCGTPITFAVRIDHAGVPPEVRGVDLDLTVPTTLVTIVSPTFAGDFAEGSVLSSLGETTYFAAVDQGGGTYTVSGAILGGTSGATDSGELFYVTMTPTGAEGTGNVVLANLQLRDPDNAALPGTITGGTVQVDCTVPTMEAIAEAENECYNSAPTFSNFGFDDDVNLDLAEYQIDALGWNTIFSGIDATEYNDDGWMLPGFAGLSEGSHTVYFRVKDDAGNVNGEGTPDTYSWAFIKDTTPPDPPTDFVALPGHNKTHLSWTNPAGDPSFVGVEIRVVGWTDYPEYGTPGPAAPSYPANETEGTLVTQAAGTSYDDNPRTPRDIYYYSAFSYDCAGNYSALGPTAKDRTTSYWLGDINPTGSWDGNVDINDLAPFSNAFGTSDGDLGWNNEADFGPTDDFSRFGIPLPDNIIQFEDLMIFAMNYGNVTPAGVSRRLATTAPALADEVSVRLVLKGTEGSVSTYALVLDNNAEVLKGVSVTVDLGVGSELVAARAAGGGKRSNVFFGTVAGEHGQVDLCAAALGVGVPLTVSGEIAEIEVSHAAEMPAEVRISGGELRDLENRGAEVSGTKPGGTPYMPKSTAVFQNTPNPFNPTTTIAFDVATPGVVTIRIYDVSGRLVRTLTDGERPQGRHTEVWDGRDNRGSAVRSGIYFYRMTAPGYRSPTKKMLLLK